MPGSLGEKIGEGLSADVHAWAPGQVVKLFKAGTPRRVPWWEARMTRAVFSAGAPAPEVLGEVSIDGRSGIVLQRLDGPTLLQLSRSGAMTPAQTGATLAALCHAVHRTPPPRDVLPLRAYMDHSLRLHGGALPAHFAPGILALIERLSPDDALSHGDTHPANVIMTAQGPRLIDWISAARGPAALDLGSSHIVLSEMAPETVADPERPRAVDVAMQAEYARLSGLSPAALTATMRAWLPVVAVRVLLGGGWPAGQERMMRRVEAALRPEVEHE